MRAPGSDRPTPAATPVRAGGAPLWSPLQHSVRTELGVALVLSVLAATGLAWVADLGPDYPLKALALFGVGAALVWRALGDGTGPGSRQLQDLHLPHHPHHPNHPHARFGPANRVTLLRLVLATLLAALVGETVMQPPAAQGATGWWVVVVATAAALLDAVDGALARRSGLASPFGARFDMETDAAYTLVLCVLVLQAGQAGPWVLASGLLRYGFVAAARVWPWLSSPLPPSRRRQTVCVIQITVLIVCLGPIVPPTLAALLAASSLILLAASFAIDVRHLAHSRPPSTET
jgi:phosphatidylglycerophosphate synthase